MDGERRRNVFHPRRFLASLDLTKWKRTAVQGTRRALVLLFAAAVVWFGSAGAPPAHASTTAVAPVERVMSADATATVDRLVDEYVRAHMFDDDVYDPVESAYREAYQDKTTAQHPQALQEITSEAVGTNKNMVAKVDGKSAETGFAKTMFRASQSLQNRFGLSSTMAIVTICFGMCIALPGTILFTGLALGMRSKSTMNRVMKKRYGNTYEVDATLEPVDLEEDDDEEADDDEEDGEDDDEEDSDDSEDGD